MQRAKNSAPGKLFGNATVDVEKEDGDLFIHITTELDPADNFTLARGDKFLIQFGSAPFKNGKSNDNNNSKSSDIRESWFPFKSYFKRKNAQTLKD